ncbi:MAG TPA: NAD(P)H-dependent oxidoreductase subunit E, partial [Actinomycetota bacterium]|nr:NAD(P)H-dependent oxidoreductase subunit E [Actinomycetota bacterium]
MDLHLMSAQPTEEERRAVDALLGPAVPADDRVVRGGHETEGDRTLLLPALHVLHAAEGWISEGGLNYICERLTVPPAEAYGVATFYAMFSVRPQPKSMVHVCDDLACRIQGTKELLAELEAQGADGDWTW